MTTTIEELLHRIEVLEYRVKELEKRSPRSKFVPPLYEDVAAYILEGARKKNNCSWTLQQIREVAVEFVDFYESKGWKVGNAPMKDWQAAIRRWVRTNHKEQSQKSKSNGAKSQHSDLASVSQRAIEFITHGSN